MPGSIGSGYGRWTTRLGSFPVERRLPGLDASIANVEAVAQWQFDAGLPESPFGDMALEESLELVGSIFRSTTKSFDFSMASTMPFGTLTLTSSDGTEWEAAYSAG
jgi:hypothetical protein